MPPSGEERRWRGAERFLGEELKMESSPKKGLVKVCKYAIFQLLVEVDQCVRNLVHVQFDPFYQAYKFFDKLVHQGLRYGIPDRTF